MDDKIESTNNVFNLQESPGLNNMPNQNKKSSLKKVSIFSVLLITLIIYSAGLILFTYSITARLNEKNLKGVLIAFHNPNSPLFLNLTGTFTGKIVEIKGDKVWANTEKGGKIILSIQEPVQVSEFSGSELKQIGTTIDKIKLNENATITVAGYGSGYIITAITYLNGTVPTLNPPANPLERPKPATQSGKIKK